jgi:hypothetical protein
MNSLIDLAGAFLYFAVNIIIFPLIVLLDTLMGFVATIRYIRRLSVRMQQRLLRKQPMHSLNVKKNLVAVRSRFVSTPH